MAPELGLGLLWYAVFVASLTLHETAHGLVALGFGDATARDAGLVTLDPMAHARRSPFGMVIVPIVSFLTGGLMIGWARTPYDPHWASRNRRQAALMALAGPAANLLLILVAAVIIRCGMLVGVFAQPDETTLQKVTVATTAGLTNGAAVLVSVLFSLNLILMTFNLLPLPPLDGSEVVSLFLNDHAAERYKAITTQPGARIIGLIVAWHALDFVLDPVQVFALNLLYPGAGYH